nr:MAG TPA: hypothetical protein [Caudoviricetes sp.]
MLDFSSHLTSLSKLWILLGSLISRILCDEDFTIPPLESRELCS